MKKLALKVCVNEGVSIGSLKKKKMFPSIEELERTGKIRKHKGTLGTKATCTEKTPGRRHFARGYFWLKCWMRGF